MLSLRLLKDNLQDSQFSARYQHLLAALLCCVGRGLREEFDRQCWLVSVLTKVAHKVRDTALSSRQSGDDLRQDMLTLQVIRVMNKIWIQEGLDMRMVIFKCFSTGRGRGMVEMIPQADTLRKIQVEHGVTGSFKDRPLADWLQKHNPTDEQYDKAVENFIYSCAGCCVATYILGICDRHNDNIMLKTSGHMFHIDFGKFLGHAQMFGNIKRDRAPFVFTSDMAYVINGGDKPSSRFHDFVDLCCEAYNLIRKHTHLFLNLLGLMLSCGIPELSDLEDLKYVYDALRPHESEADATMYFTRLIESSLGSVATKLNFFIHNLAQMKFTSSEDRPTLSFAPRVHTAKSDGLIRNLYICRHIRTVNKGYQPLQDGTDPDPYVKLYLLPDPQKTSKRKTKAARRTCNPTYNEMLVYERIPRGDLDQRVIHLRVLGDGAFWENTVLGETFIPLKRLVPGQHWVDWHQLGAAGSDSAH
ncbi:Phosphatidylinositol 4-phosphate 3-kinase C2 domain-containing subunit beta [Larimichthys crocea]|nr:Phosphatidylinositol 4-phosphate 3-kinase C2 domain-containing subunit beta [Larimichthys crocea]